MKKKIIKVVLMILTLFVLSVPCVAMAEAETFEYDGYIFEVLDETSVKLKDGTSIVLTTIDVPGVVYDGQGNSYKVTEIGNKAFEGSNATKISFPATVNKLGIEVFVGSKIEILDICETNLKMFGENTSSTKNAFRNTSATPKTKTEYLKQIILPNSFELDHNRLQTIVLVSSENVLGERIIISMPDNDKYVFEGDYIYNSDKTEIIYYNKSLESNTPVVIPDGVEKICTQAFMYCDKISEVTIPVSLTEIGVDAFSHCEGLTKVNFAENDKINTIVQRAFEACSSLGDFIVPENVSQLDTSTFRDSGVEKIYLPANVDIVTTAPNNGVFAGTGDINIYYVNLGIEGKFRKSNNTDPDAILICTNGGKLVRNTWPDNPEFEKEGYEFDGWYDNKELTGNAVNSFNSGKNYYAKWIIDTENYAYVNYSDGVNVNNDTEKVIVKKYKVSGDEYTLEKNKFARNGYTFAGWKIGETTYNEEATVPITNDTTITAVWQLNEPTASITTGTSEKTYDGMSIIITAQHDAIEDKTYQWYKCGENGQKSELPGETNATLELTNVSDSGKYCCRVSIGNWNGYTNSVGVDITPCKVLVSAKNQEIDINDTLDTTVDSDTIQISTTNMLTIEQVVETGAVSISLGDSLGNGKYKIKVLIDESRKYALDNYVLEAGDNGVLTVTAVPTIELDAQSVAYTGNPVKLNPANVRIQGYDELGEPPNNTDVHYKYFSDSSCNEEINWPVNVGEYYIKAYTNEKNAYRAAESAPAKLTIKAVLQITPKSWTVSSGTKMNETPVEDLIGFLQTTGIVLNDDFSDWVEWSPQNTVMDGDIEEFLSSENLVLKLGNLDNSLDPIKSYPIVIYLDESSNEVIEFKERFEIVLNDENATLKIKPQPVFKWSEEATDGIVVEYTGSYIDLVEEKYLVVTDNNNSEINDGSVWCEYYVAFDMIGEGVTDALKDTMETEFGIVFGNLIPFNEIPSLPEKVVLLNLASEFGINLDELATINVYPTMQYYAIPYYSGGSVLADGEGEPIKLDIVPREIVVKVKNQNLYCTDPLIEDVNDIIDCCGEFVLDSETFLFAAEVTEGSLNEELEYAIADGSLSLTLGEKDPVNGEHSYTQSINIGYSKSMNDEVKQLIPLFYDIEFIPGLLTVMPHTLEISWDNIENRIVGDGKTVTAQIESGINGTVPNVTISVENGNQTAAGTYTATASLIGEDSEYYIINPAQVTKKYSIAESYQPPSNDYPIYIPSTTPKDEPKDEPKAGSHDAVMDEIIACTEGSSCPISEYTDIPEDAWYHDGVHYCIERNIMGGYGNGIFKPDAAVSRAMISAMLWNLEGSPVVNYALQYKDVPSDVWYTEAVRWMVAEGLAGGYGNGIYAPEDELTREQLAAILQKYAQYKGYDMTKGTTVNLQSYGDVQDVSAWADEAMQWICDNGIVGGMPGKDGKLLLNPAGQATRAQVATMLMTFCENMEK